MLWNNYWSPKVTEQTAKPYFAEHTSISAVIGRIIAGMNCITFGNIYSKVNEQ